MPAISVVGRSGESRPGAMRRRLASSLSAVLCVSIVSLVYYIFMRSQVQKASNDIHKVRYMYSTGSLFWWFSLPAFCAFPSNEGYFRNDSTVSCCSMCWRYLHVRGFSLVLSPCCVCSVFSVSCTRFDCPPYTEKVLLQDDVCFRQ